MLFFIFNGGGGGGGGPEPFKVGGGGGGGIPYLCGGGDCIDCIENPPLAGGGGGGAPVIPPFKGGGAGGCGIPFFKCEKGRCPLLLFLLVSVSSVCRSEKSMSARLRDTLYLSAISCHCLSPSTL